MRVLSGPSGIWCLGASGTALLPHSYADTSGELSEVGRLAVSQGGIEEAPAAPKQYSLTVVTSTDCNLGCPYCFQNTAPAEPGRFDPPRIPKLGITKPVIEQIAALAREGLNRLQSSELFVLLFGGEPLLNRQGCYQLLERLGSEGSVRASMVTNGVLFTPTTARRLEQLGLRSVQITLDGPAESHDRLRANRAGRGTFDTIVDNLATVQDATDVYTTLRVNATPATLQRLGELVELLAGRLDPTRCTFDIAPVLNYENQFADILRRQTGELRAIVEAYDAALLAGFRVAPPAQVTCMFCSEQRGKYGAVINADGTLYSCWETIGRAGWEVGDLTSGYQDYDPASWVSCGDFAEHSSAPAAEGQFDDQLAVETLELLRWHRLRTTEPQLASVS